MPGPGQRLQFAYSDLSGYSAFEEAFSQGDRCGRGPRKTLDLAVLGWVKRRVYGTALQRIRSLRFAICLLQSGHFHLEIDRQLCGEPFAKWPPGLDQVPSVADDRYREVD
jgi:hypothetical protein